MLTAYPCIRTWEHNSNWNRFDARKWRYNFLNSPPPVRPLTTNGPPWYTHLANSMQHIYRRWSGDLRIKKPIYSKDKSDYAKVIVECTWRRPIEHTRCLRAECIQTIFFAKLFSQKRFTRKIGWHFGKGRCAAAPFQDDKSSKGLLAMSLSAIPSFK